MMGSGQPVHFSRLPETGSAVATRSSVRAAEAFLRKARIRGFLTDPASNSIVYVLWRRAGRPCSVDVERLESLVLWGRRSRPQAQGAC